VMNVPLPRLHSNSINQNKHPVPTFEEPRNPVHFNPIHLYLANKN
jgi:hypothetical protein